ncbi:MAG: hypothetical protein LUH10_04370 [Tannerellaceae bacterium]|nr:hypothetical protein [Tannerellaceae bacterium]
METTIPAGIAEAVIGVPAAKVREIHLNGTPIWKNGKYIETANATLYTGGENEHIKFLVGNGTYRLEAFY